MTRRYQLFVGLIGWIACATAALADAPSGRYTFPATGTVYDTRTQLTWQQAVDPGTYTQSAASTYCTGLSLAGGGWRLPTKAELESIVDDTRSNPSIDPTAFPSTPGNYFWSSSPYVAASGGYGWFVNFISGLSGSNYYVIGNYYRVRCVR
jgi:hypothetical protein